MQAITREHPGNNKNNKVTPSSRAKVVTFVNTTWMNWSRRLNGNVWNLNLILLSLRQFWIHCFWNSVGFWICNHVAWYTSFVCHFTSFFLFHSVKSSFGIENISGAMQYRFHFYWHKILITVIFFNYISWFKVGKLVIFRANCVILYIYFY